MVQHPHFIVEGMEAQRVGGRAQHFTGLLTPGSLLESWGWDQQALHPVPCSLRRDLEGLCDCLMESHSQLRVNLDSGSPLAVPTSTVAPGAPTMPCLQVLGSSILVLARAPRTPWTLGGQGLSGSV